MKNLDESVEDIIDAVVGAIRDELSGGELSDVQDVVRGDRARPMPKLPAVWVVPQPARFNQETYGDEETWSMPISIAALVKSDDPDTGGRLAQSISARARAAALPARPVNVDITDVRSETFDPTARSSERNRNLFWCEAVIRVTFTVDEE